MKPGDFLAPINIGDLLLTNDLALVVIDSEHDDGSFTGRRLSDGETVELAYDEVFRVYAGGPLGPRSENA